MMDFLRRRLSDGNFLAGGGSDFGGPHKTPPTPAPLLLVVGQPHIDWVKLFRGKSVHGDVELRVEQAQFSELSCVASTHGSLTVTIEPHRGAVRRLRPDYVLFREEPRGGPAGSVRRFLMGLQLGGVPATTPISAAITAAHPPAMLAQAMQLQKELGSEGFPMAPMRFCHRPRALLTAPTFPMLVTLSPAPGGVDTVRVSSPEALGAVAGVMAGVRAGALIQQETPKDGGFRLRVQRIGAESRALRAPLSDPEQMEAVTLSPRHRDWLSACSRLLGGAEICGLEAEVEPDGSERITRVMGSWLPLSGPEDQSRIVEVVLGRMRAELGPPRGPPRPRPQMPAIGGTPTQQRPPPQGAPPSDPPKPRPQGGVASASPRPPQPRGPIQPRPPGPQPRPQTPPIGQQRPQAPPTTQPRPQTPPIGQPRAQAPPTANQATPSGPQPRPQGQPRPQTPPIGQLRPQTPPSGSPASPIGQQRPQTPPTSPQPRPQASPIGQPRPQAPPTSPQPRPQAPPTSPQPRPQAPPIGQTRPQAPPTSPQPRPQAPPIGQQRPQAPPTSPQPRPQAPPTSPQPRPQTPPIGQPRPQTPPTSPQPRPQTPPIGQPRPQAPPTTRQPRPQAPPPGPKPALVPKPGSSAPPPPDAARSLRQSLASFFE